MSTRLNQVQDKATRIPFVNTGNNVALAAERPEDVCEPHQPLGLMKYLPPALIAISAALSVVWTAALFWFALTLFSA